MQVLWHAVRGRLAPWVAGAIMLVGTQAATMAIPELFRRAIDGIAAGAPAASLVRLAWLLVCCAAAGMAFRLASRVLILFAARDVEMRLRGRYFAHLTEMDPAFFTRWPSGDLMSRSTNDLLQVRLMLGPGALNIINTAVAYAVALPLMLRLSVPLTLAVLAIYPLGVLGMRHLGRRMFAQNRRQQAALGALSNVIQENVAGWQLVRVFAVENRQRAAFAAKNRAHFLAGRALTVTRSLMSRFSVSLTHVATWVAVWVGVREAMAGRLTLGTVVAMVEYMALLAFPTFALGWIWSLWQRGRASLGRLEEILRERSSIVAGEAAPASLAPSLAARGLSVTRGGRAVLVDICFAMPAGARLGVVGPIGSGKTTLLAALLRLLPVPPGALFIGDVDVTRLSLAAARAMFGYVPQNPALMSKSIAENVAFGRPGAPREEVERALAAAAMDVDVALLPRGLDTLVGERGISLSGGQKQRVAIARALLLAPPILVLDDALSAVDVGTERRIIHALGALRAGASTVIVSHRLSAVEACERILVLEGGRVVEQGPADALRRAGGRFAAMARRETATGAA